MIHKPDLSESQDELRAGTYKSRIVKATPGSWQTQNGEVPYINWELETYGESDAKNNGRRIFHKTALAGKGAFQLQKLYKAAVGEPLTGEFDDVMLMGKAIEVDVVDGKNRQTGEPTGYLEVKAVRAVRGN